MNTTTVHPETHNDESTHASLTINSAAQHPGGDHTTPGTPSKPWLSIGFLPIDPYHSTLDGHHHALTTYPEDDSNGTSPPLR